MTGYVVEISTAHVFVIMGIGSFLAVLSSRLPMILSPRSAFPSVGFSLFASWHGYETLTVSLVTHKSGGNIELYSTWAQRNFDIIKSIVLASPLVTPQSRCGTWPLYRRDEKPAAVQVSDQDSRTPLNTRVEIALIAWP